ncbi:MAG: hypothetical protein H0V97_12835 [Actinobacteria bacterium]|nr:hypothetical protein [Actinomycetota bacterium]
MTRAFLAVLAIAWITIFLPALLRAGRKSPLSTAERFTRRMALMAPKSTRGRWVVVPESSARLARVSYRRSRQARKRLFIGLLLAAVASGFAALLGAGAMWEVHLAVDASLALYVVLLIETKRRSEEQQRKVTRLQHPDSVPANELRQAAE